MYFVGLDVHTRTSSICILDSNGKLVKQETIRGRWTLAVARLLELRKPWSICYEASCGYGAVYEALHPFAKRIAVAHPGQLRLIFKSKRKNDRVDARKLALLLLLDQVPEVHVPNKPMRAWRSMIEFRHRLVTKQTRVKNALRALLRAEGVETPAKVGLWTRQGLEWVTNLAFPSELLTLQRDMLLEELDGLKQRIERVEKALKEFADHDPRVTLLRTIPGVGPRTAEAMVAYIDDPRRFQRNRQIGAYFGLIPCQDASAGRNRLGHVTKEGPATPRTLLVEATWQGIQRSQQIRAYFERIMKGDPDRRKIALVATAHYLARVMLAMLVSGRGWLEDDEAKKVA